VANGSWLVLPAGGILLWRDLGVENLRRASVALTEESQQEGDCPQGVGQTVIVGRAIPEPPTRRAAEDGSALPHRPSHLGTPPIGKHHPSTQTADRPGQLGRAPVLQDDCRVGPGRQQVPGDQQQEPPAGHRPALLVEYNAPLAVLFDPDAGQRPGREALGRGSGRSVCSGIRPAAGWWCPARTARAASRDRIRPYRPGRGPRPETAAASRTSAWGDRCRCERSFGPRPGVRRPTRAVRHHPRTTIRPCVACRPDYRPGSRRRPGGGGWRTPHKPRWPRPFRPRGSPSSGAPRPRRPATPVSGAGRRRR